MDELYKQKKFEQAILLAEELLAICRELSGERTASTAFAIHQLAHFHYSKGNLAEAQKLHEQALAIRREVLGNKHPHTELSLHNLANALLDLGKYEQALACHLESLDIRRQAIGENSPEFAKALQGSAAIYWMMDRDDDALKNSEQALAIRQKVLGNNHPDTAQTLQYLSKLLARMKRFDEARRYAEQFLAANTAIFGEKDPRVVDSLLELAVLCEYLADFDTEQSCYEKALAIHKQALGDDHPDTVEVGFRLGSMWLRKGNAKAAFEYYQNALAKSQQTPGNDKSKTIFLLVELGNMYSQVADHATARSYFEKGLAVITEQSGAQNPATLQARIPLAACLDRLGDRAAAQAQFQQALAIRSRSLPEKHIDTAYLYHELGGFLRAIGKPETSKKYLERALAVRKELLGPANRRTANTLDSLTSTCADLQDFAAARSYCEQALAVREQTLPKEHPDIARAYAGLGFIAACGGDAASAVSYLEKSLAMSRALLEETHPDLTVTLANLGLITAASGDFLKAANFIDQSRRSVRRHVSGTLANLPERDQLTYLARNDGLAAQTALAVGATARDNPIVTALSAGWLLNYKGLAQEVLSARTLAARESDDPRVRAIADRLQAVRAQQARFVLAAPCAQARSISFERAKLSRDEESLSRQLAQLGNHTPSENPWVELDDVRAKLSPDEVLIDISRFRLRDFDVHTLNQPTGADHYVAWIIPPSANGDVKIVDLGEALVIDRAVMALRGAIKSVYVVEEATGRIKAVDAKSVEIFNAALVHLSQVILHPLLKQVGPATELIISPDAGLWLVPWNALLTNDGRFAIEQYQIRHVVSGRQLVAPYNPHSPGRPLIVASPDFDLDPATANQRSKAVLAGSKLSDTRVAAQTTSTRSAHPIAAPLPGFHKQVDLVTPRLFKYAGKKPAVFTDQNALEGLVKAVHGPRVLLFATHGFFEPELAMSPDERKAIEEWLTLSNGAPSPIARPPANPLLNCGLLLAGCNQREHSEVDDGILTGIEIISLDLRGTELVVLSACDTGVGEVLIGEGVAGVRQAFQLAGAEAVVATLWPITDRAATLEIADFFSNLAAGQSKAQALRNAQLAAIARLKKQYGVAPPHYWAAFTFTGR